MNYFKDTFNKVKNTVSSLTKDKFKYFTIEELCRSATANELNIDNRPTDKQKVYLRLLILNILDPLREAYGKPTNVTSGFRCEELNIAVGGSLNSHHKCNNGYAAADIDTYDKNENIKLFNLAQELNLPFCQLILENGGEWLHISYNANDIRKQVLKR